MFKNFILESLAVFMLGLGIGAYADNAQPQPVQIEAPAQQDEDVEDFTDSGVDCIDDCTAPAKE